MDDQTYGRSDLISSSGCLQELTFLILLVSGGFGQLALYVGEAVQEGFLSGLGCFLACLSEEVHSGAVLPLQGPAR